MKKGILNVIIIVLLVTNIILSSIIVFAVVPAMSSATKLISKVAEAIDLQKEASSDNGDVNIDDLESYTIENKITANLKTGADGKTHYIQVKVILMLDTEDEGYKRYKDKIGSNEEYIKGKIIDILSKYTNENVSENKEAIQREICSELTAYFNNTKFINSVSFSEFIVS